MPFENISWKSICLSCGLNRTCDLYRCCLSDPNLFSSLLNSRVLCCKISLYLHMLIAAWSIVQDIAQSMCMIQERIFRRSDFQLLPLSFKDMLFLELVSEYSRIDTGCGFFLVSFAKYQNLKKKILFVSTTVCLPEGMLKLVQGNCFWIKLPSSECHFRKWRTISTCIAETKPLLFWLDLWVNVSK